MGKDLTDEHQTVRPSLGLIPLRWKVIQTVEEAAIAGRHDEICRYGEADTVMLYCAWLRYQLAAGDLTPDSHTASLASLGEAIEEMGDNGVHLAAFGALGAA